MCNRHYQQQRTHGNIQPEPLTFPASFWARVDKGEDDECWPWRGGGVNGYGYITHDGHRMRVHVLSYELTFGPVPEGKEIDHLCHEPKDCPGGSACPHRRCVNPRHLAAKTHAENCAGDRTVLGFQYHQRAKTQCPRGHEYDDANTYVSARGHRRCRKCDADLRRERRRRVRV